MGALSIEGSRKCRMHCPHCPPRLLGSCPPGSTLLTFSLLCPAHFPFLAFTHTTDSLAPSLKRA